MNEGESIKDNYFYDNFSKDKSSFKINKKKVYKCLAVIVFVAVLFLYTISSPGGFKKEKLFSIQSGSSLTAISNNLEKEAIIRSPMMFRLFVRLFEGSKSIKAGDYFFEKPHNVINVAWRLVKGERGFSPITVVVPEGNSVSEIAEIIKKDIKNFNDKKFIELAISKEGHLFPDSYTFMFDTKPEEVLKVMEENFNEKINSISADIKRFNKPISDIIKMASIVEEEGRSFEVRRMVAGILWKRLEIGMPLQVDATFKYINGKTTFELTTEDLIKDSPYNTYTRKGLPPTAITNPGLDSIRATITPIKSNYLYYLTDKNGVMRYAVTHGEHVANKERYLR